MKYIDFADAKLVMRPLGHAAGDDPAPYDSVMRRNGVEFRRGRKHSWIKGTFHQLVAAYDEVVHGPHGSDGTMVFSVNAVIASLPDDFRLTFYRKSFQANKTKLLTPELFRFGQLGDATIYAVGKWSPTSCPTEWERMAVSPRRLAVGPASVHGFSIGIMELAHVLSHQAQQT